MNESCDYRDMHWICPIVEHLPAIAPLAVVQKQNRNRGNGEDQKRQAHGIKYTVSKNILTIVNGEGTSQDDYPRLAALGQIQQKRQQYAKGPVVTFDEASQQKNGRRGGQRGGLVRDAWPIGNIPPFFQEKCESRQHSKQVYKQERQGGPIRFRAKKQQQTLSGAAGNGCQHRKDHGPPTLPLQLLCNVDAGRGKKQCVEDICQIQEADALPEGQIVWDLTEQGKQAQQCKVLFPAMRMSARLRCQKGIQRKSQSANAPHGGRLWKKRCPRMVHDHAGQGDPFDPAG